MKYLTKKWEKERHFAGIHYVKRVCKSAEEKDDELFIQLYRSRYKRFLAREKQLLKAFKNPHDAMKLIMEYCNAPDISEEERHKREIVKTAYEEVERDRLKLGLYYCFDERVLKIIFEGLFKRNLIACGGLPKEIINEIADIRVFALGYCSKKVKTLLIPFSEKMMSKTKKAVLLAHKQNNLTEEKLAKVLNINNLEDAILMYIDRQNNDILLHFADITLQLKNGVIIDKEREKIYQWNADIPYSGMTSVVAVEFTGDKGNLELHFLMRNIDFYERISIWQLTFACDDVFDITEISAYKTKL